MKTRVVIFGLDGGTYTVLDDLVRRGIMPHFAEFFRRGARGKLASVIPPLTPPAWTTLVTGRSPGRHGITNFLQYESDTSTFVRLVTSREISCETIWSMVNRGGMRAASLNFVAHNPGPKIDGIVIPGWISWRWVRQQSHPADLIERYKRDVPGFDVKELAMNFTEEEKAIAGAALEEYEPWIELHLKRERQWFGVMKHVMTREPCELTAIVFDGVDKLQHLLWQFLDPALEPATPAPAWLRIRERVWDYFRQLDGFLGETLRIVGPEAHVFMVSDHGFTGSNEILYINMWLEQQGYLTWLPETAVQEDTSQELGALRPYFTKPFDLTRTRAYASAASNNGIHIPVRGVRGENGIEPGEYLKFREELIDELLTRCVDPVSGEPLVTNVWTREQAFGGPKMQLAPDLTIALRDKGNFSVLRSSGILKPRETVMGCHHPDGIFIAHGPGVQAGASLEKRHLLDIAPTVLYALGLPIPEDLEGRPATDAFTRDHVAAHPAIFAGATQAGETPAAAEAEELDEEGNAQVMMRLKALGYIE